MLSKREGQQTVIQLQPPRLQGIGKNPNVSHAKAFKPTKQKSETVERRYTYGMGTPSLGRCPVAVYYRTVTYPTVTFRPTTYPTVTYQPVT